MDFVVWGWDGDEVGVGEFVIDFYELVGYVLLVFFGLVFVDGFEEVVDVVLCVYVMDG